MSRLVCPDCRHENEPERIYCHNCGARLDRTSVNKEKGQAGESEAQTQKRLKKMFDPRRGQAKELAAKLGKVLLGALATAVVVVMILPPTDVPPESNNYSFAPMINMDMVSALSSPQPASLVYNEEQVNSYIASTLRRKDSPASEGYFPLRRIRVEFREGECAIGVRRQFFGLSIYGGSSYRVQLENGKIVAHPTAAHIGRMPIHPALAKVTNLFLDKAWAALDRERHSIAKLAGIEFHPQSVTLIARR